MTLLFKEHGENASDDDVSSIWPSVSQLGERRSTTTPRVNVNGPPCPGSCRGRGRGAAKRVSFGRGRRLDNNN